VIPLPTQDLARIVDATAALWTPWRRKRILLTGATGFFGCWLLESLGAANRALGLELEIYAQSRAPDKFIARVPHLGRDAGIRWIACEPVRISVAELRDAQAREVPQLDAMIHLVTEADGGATVANPKAAFETIAGTTRSALALAAATGVQRFLFTSSGSVYAREPAAPERIPETQAVVPEPADYRLVHAIGGRAKWVAEQHCAEYAERHGFDVAVARGFTFVGPHLPLQGKFALGNFLGDALNGRDIHIQGDGTPVRSYLYAADLAVWLWRILLRGISARPYNVGSEHAASLREVADTVRREVAPAAAVKVLSRSDPARPPDRYVPDTTRARTELGLSETIMLPEALRRTAAWFRQCERR
jgi:nucleoside-diphosphate-sugar epimerase